MLQVSSDPLAVLLIFPSEGLSAELLLLPYLKVEHDDGEERKEQMKDIRKCQQQADVHQVETHEGRVAAYPEYSVLHQLRPVFVGVACPPAVSHGQHGDNEEGNADGGDAKPCPLQRGAFPERREESHLREYDDAEYLDGNHCEGCPSHNVLDQEDLPWFGALAYLVRGDALPALDKFLAQVSSIEYAHEGYCNIFLYHRFVIFPGTPPGALRWSKPLSRMIFQFPELFRGSRVSRLLSWMSRTFPKLFRGIRVSRLRRFLQQASVMDESNVSGTLPGESR